MLKTFVVSIGYRIYARSPISTKERGVNDVIKK